MSETVNEILGVAESLRAARDLLPWVILIIVVFVVWRCRKHILDWFQASINEKKDNQVYHAQQNELIRNNTAALNNNTAALELVQKDREMLAEMVNNHEKLSAERIAHLQTVVNRIDMTVTENSKNISMIEDRTASN